MVHVDNEVIIDLGSEDKDEFDEDNEDNLAIFEEADVAEALLEDDGRAAHDKAVLKTIRGKAIAMMAVKGVVISAAENVRALQLFPKVWLSIMWLSFHILALIKSQVSGLACHIHDGTTLKEKFDKLVKVNIALEGDKTALDCQVATCWNSNLACLDAHVHFKNVIQQLTGLASNKLQAYWLTALQWELAEELVDVLLVTFLCFPGPLV